MSEDQSVSGHTLRGGRPMWEVRPGPVTGASESTDPGADLTAGGADSAGTWAPAPQVEDTQQIPVVRPEVGTVPEAPHAVVPEAPQAVVPEAPQAAVPEAPHAVVPGSPQAVVAQAPQHSVSPQQAAAAPVPDARFGPVPQWQPAPSAEPGGAQPQGYGDPAAQWPAQPATSGADPAQWQQTPVDAAQQQWDSPAGGWQAAAPVQDQFAGGQFDGGYPGQPSQSPYPGQGIAPAPERVPTAQDFLQGRHQAIDIGPANWGWRGWIRRWSFGLIKPKMGPKEREHREARAAVQRSFSGPRTIVFANPKGGAAKTTSVLAAGFTFGTIRGGGVVAWDNNETRGTLGIRGERANHQNTTRELLDDLERFSDVYESRIGDLGAFVRSQGDAHFDVLASDERADVTGQIKASDFGAVHRLLERFYHLILVDTGNNLRAENWLASAEAADLIVVTCTVREDTGYSGLWMLDALADAGHADLQARTVTILADPSPSVDAQLADDLVDVYSQRTRAVFRIPYDPALVAGSVVQYAQLSEATRAAWLKACAEMARAL